MRRFCAILATLVLSTCCAPQGFPGDADRLEVTDDLRASCPTYTEEQIEMLISVIEADRIAGNPYAIEISIVTAGCQNAECGVCLVAITDQVYVR